MPQPQQRLLLCALSIVARVCLGQQLRRALHLVGRGAHAELEYFRGGNLFGDGVGFELELLLVAGEILDRAGLLGRQFALRFAQPMQAFGFGQRALLPDELRAMGAEVDEVEIYRTEPDTTGAAALGEALDRGMIDLLTFSSGSTVRFFIDAVGAERARHVPAVSIGPITSEAAGAAGIQVVGEAGEPSIDGLVDAVLRALPASSRNSLLQGEHQAPERTD